MTKVGPFQVLSVILCDQVRSETGGTFTIVGALGGDILVDEFPAQLGLGAFLDTKSDQKGDFKIEFRVSSQQSESRSNVEGRVEVDFVGVSALPVPTLPFTMNKPGKFALEMNVDDGGWKTLIERAVRQRKQA